MKKAIIFLSLFTFASLAFPKPSLALKKRVFTTPAKPAVKTVSSSTSVGASIRKDRKAVILKVNNPAAAQSVAYELTYVGNEIDQGVVGSIYANEGPVAERTLLFGTCSHGVCTYHRNIKNAQLVVTARLNNGKTLIKRYKIKI